MRTSETNQWIDAERLQVWWMPQMPGKAFEVEVASVAEGVKLLDALANYDLFQFENNVKPDYANCGGLNAWSEDCDGNGTPGWSDWYDEATGEDNPRVWLEEQGTPGYRASVPSEEEI